MLGEIKDDKYKTINSLTKINREIQSLTYFKFRLKGVRPIIDIADDIYFFQNRYNLTKSIKLLNSQQKSGIFSRPFLYDLTNNTPIFKDNAIYRERTYRNNAVICTCTTNPLIRMHILDNAIVFGKTFIINNKDISSYRYLRQLSIPVLSIIRVSTASVKNMTLEAGYLLYAIKISFSRLYISCYRNRITNIKNTIIKLRNSNKINGKIYYIC